MKKLCVIVIAVILLLGILAAAGGVGIYFWALQDLPRIKTITDYNPPLTTTVHARDGQVLGYLAKENRFLVPLKKMSPSVVQAFLASEDSGFYEHEGIDFLGIFRAAIKNFQAGTIVQGGSTITQQVIKALLLTPERSYKRKLKEAILAYRLEKYLSKDEILTIYLNHIYLGHRAYGIEAAARTYFAKHASELSLAEAAVLAGLPKAPSMYDPFRHPEVAKSRQTYVLRRLEDLGWISEQAYQTAMEQPLDVESMEDPSWEKGPSYMEEVRRWLVNRFGEETAYTGGLKVTTAVDLKHQQAAQRAVKFGLEASTKRRGWRGPVRHLEPEQRPGFSQNGTETMQAFDGEWVQVLVQEVSKGGAQVSFGNSTGWLDVASMDWCREIDPSKAPEEVRDVKDAREVLQAGDVVWASVQDTEQTEDGKAVLALEQFPEIQGGLVSLDPETGEILALVGGYDFSNSQFNRATQARRQTGSAFKPIVYSAALDNGFTPASVLLDAPIVYTDYATNSTWKPENYERVSFGPTLLRTALVKSRNLVTIRVARQIGIDTVIERARALGLEGDFPRDLSVSLGSASVTLVNLCQAFSGFARGGSIIDPRLVISVEDSWGNELFASKPKVTQVLSAQTAYIVTYLMQQVVQQGTGWRVKVLGRPIAGKTGTTDEQKDAWFMGFAPYLLSGVYVGFDNPRPMGKYETGSRAAAPIWLKYRQEVESDHPVQDFARPERIVMARVDVKNGLLAGPESEKTYLLPFKAGTQPEEMSPQGRTQARDEQGRTSPDSQDDMLKELF